MSEIRSRKIGCCGADKWAQGIAFIDMGLSLAAFVCFWLEFRIVLTLYTETLAAMKNSQSTLICTVFQDEENSRRIYIKLCKYLSFVGCISNVLFFIGAQKGKPDYLRMWLIKYEILAGLVFLLIGACFVLYIELHILGLIIALILSAPLALLVFSICIVSVYHQELIDKDKRLSQSPS